MSKEAMRAAVEALEHICRRLQMDIDDGGRPDQWSMEDLVRKAQPALSLLRAELEAGGEQQVSTARGCNPEEDGSLGDSTIPAAGNLVTAIEEALASLDAGMVMGAADTLREALAASPVAADTQGMRSSERLQSWPMPWSTRRR